MTDLATHQPKRKVLSLKLEKPAEARAEISSDPTRFVLRDECLFMVFNENGYMPKRVYRPDEIHLACRHALLLAKESGERFHVMRSWRCFEPVE